MLCGAGRCSFAVAVHSRRVRRLHRDPQGQSVPVDSHRGNWPRRANRSRFRSARTRCTRTPSAASPRIGATRKAGAATRRTSARSTNCARCWPRAKVPTAGRDFLDRMRVDLFQDRVYVISPRGEIVDVPVGGTPLDFAYQIHTDLGHRTRGAKVNGRMVPLNYQLKNSETVEIITAKTAASFTRLACGAVGISRKSASSQQSAGLVSQAGRVAEQGRGPRDVGARVATTGRQKPAHCVAVARTGARQRRGAARGAGFGRSQCGAGRGGHTAPAARARASS